MFVLRARCPITVSFLFQFEQKVVIFDMDTYPQLNSLIFPLSSHQSQFFFHININHCLLWGYYYCHVFNVMHERSNACIIVYITCKSTSSKVILDHSPLIKCPKSVIFSIASHHGRRSVSIPDCVLLSCEVLLNLTFEMFVLNEYQSVLHISISIMFTFHCLLGVCRNWQTYVIRAG